MLKAVVCKIGKAVLVGVAVHLVSEGISKGIDLATDPEVQVKAINNFNNFKAKLKNKKQSKQKA